MIWTRTAAWTVVTLAASACWGQDPSGFLRSAGKFKGSVVRIETAGYPQGSDYETRHGTGFFVAKGGFLLTAGHVVRPRVGWDTSKPSPSHKLFALNAVGQIQALPVAPVVLYVDEQVDLALLRVIGSSYVGLPLGNSGEMNDKDFIGILAFGKDRNGPWAGSGELESAFRADVHGCMDVVMQNLHPSDSGSPLLNADGKVVGVLVKGWDQLPDSVEVFGMPINAAAPLLSMAGRNHPTALEQWLRDTPKVDATISELEGAIHELKTSWTFDPAIVRSSGDIDDRLQILIRKHLQAGYWPEVVSYWVTATVVLRSGILGGGESERTLPPLEQIETFESNDTLEIQVIELRHLERLLKTKMSQDEKERFKAIRQLQIRIRAELTLRDGEEAENIERQVVQVLTYE